MSWEPQAGGRVGWELGRRGEEGPGWHLAAGPLPSLSKPATPLHQTLFRAQASPPLSLWARQGFGERAGGGGRLKPVPLKGTSTLHTCPHPPHTPTENSPQEDRHRGPQERREGGRDGGEGENTGRKRVCTHSHILSAPALPTHCSGATAILEAGGLGKRQGVEASGACVTRALEADGTVGGAGGQEVLSLSLFPCRLSPGPAAHPVLKAHGPQTSPPLLYPDLALHTEQLEASEDGQHSALSPWPRGLSGSGLSHSHRRARTNKTPQRAPQSNCTTTAATERGHFL